MTPAAASRKREAGAWGKTAPQLAPSLPGVLMFFLFALNS
jgi:hypothetical protein